MKNTVLLSTLVFMLAAPLAAAHADLVFLQNGTLLEGVVVSEGGDMVELKTPAGVAKIAASKIAEIKKLDMIPMLKASHILLKMYEKNIAEKVLERAKKAKDEKEFAELARKFSRGPSAPQGGELGWFEIGRMVPEFQAAAFKMKVGDTSSLVKTQFGYHIIRLTDIRYKNRDTGEFFDSERKPLPLDKIRVKLYQVTDAGPGPEKGDIDVTVYNAVRDTLKKCSALDLIEEPSMHPKIPETATEPAEGAEIEFHYTLWLEASQAGDVVKVSYKLFDNRGSESKEDRGTFQGAEKAGEVCKKFAREIYGFMPKTIDEEAIKKAEEEKKKPKKPETKPETPKVTPPKPPKVEAPKPETPGPKPPKVKVPKPEPPKPPKVIPPPEPPK